MNQPLNLGGADFPRDFSVYYVATWRMFHDPSQIFNTHPKSTANPLTHPHITLQVLAIFSGADFALLTFNYYQAFWIFDVAIPSASTDGIFALTAA